MSNQARSIAVSVLSKETWSSSVNRDYALGVIEQAIREWIEDNSAIIYSDVRYNDDEQVTVSKNHYARLLKDSDFLDALNAAGVDNWEGSYYARKMMHEDNDTED